jgi:hypothetical protein
MVLKLLSSYTYLQSRIFIWAKIPKLGKEWKCAGIDTWNGKQDQKRDARSGEGKSNITEQVSQRQMNAVRRQLLTGPPWPHTSPDQLEHHSIDQPNTCMTKCKGPHHDLDDFTTYDLTTFTTSRLVIDLETGFTVQKWVSRSIKSRKVVKS